MIEHGKIEIEVKYVPTSKLYSGTHTKPIMELKHKDIWSKMMDIIIHNLTRSIPCQTIFQ